MLFFPVIGKGPQCGLLFLLYGAVANAASTDSRASFNDAAAVRTLSLQVFFEILQLPSNFKLLSVFYPVSPSFSLPKLPCPIDKGWDFPVVQVHVVVPYPSTVLFLCAPADF